MVSQKDFQYTRKNSEPFIFNSFAILFLKTINVFKSMWTSSICDITYSVAAFTFVLLYLVLHNVITPCNQYFFKYLFFLIQADTHIHPQTVQFENLICSIFFNFNFLH